MTSKIDTNPKRAFAQGIAFGDSRIRIFAVTWLSYAGFYFCRKNFSIAMPLLKEEFGFTGDDFQWIIFANLLIYMLGQFLNGVLSDRFGPRLIVSLGMVVAVVANILMGFSSIYVMFLVLGIVNGGAQSTGWPGTVKNMAPWYSRGERGVIMAWWTTCYVLGAFLAMQFAAWSISPNSPFPEWGWRRVFWFPPVVLTVIVVLFAFFTRNRPTDAGFPELDELEPEEIKEDTTNAPDSKQKNSGLASILEVLEHPTIWIAGSMYFLIKFTRYAIILWFPLYLAERFKMSADEAGYAASWYDLIGFFGVIFAGYASDKLFSARRFPVATLMLIGLSVACFFEPTLVTLGEYGPALAIGIIGFMTFGPDTLISGAGAVDIGSPERAATAVGVINGMGSCGALLSPFVVNYMEKSYGWDSIFYFFSACALIAAILSTSKWNFGGTHAEQSS